MAEGWGESVHLRGNQPLLLEPDGAWWLVESGSLALFTVALRDREPHGARAPLFTVEAGDALLGLGAWLNQIPRGVVAVPLEDVIVTKGTWADLEAYVAEDGSRHWVLRRQTDFHYVW